MLPIKEVVSIVLVNNELLFNLSFKPFISGVCSLNKSYIFFIFSIISDFCSNFEKILSLNFCLYILTNLLYLVKKIKYNLYI